MKSRTRASILVLVAFLLTWIFPTSLFAAIPQSERDALIALYEATDGANWQEKEGWLGGVGTECSWQGVTCDATQTTVVRLFLTTNSLKGELPPELGNLQGLTELNFAGNAITRVPPEFGNLTSLRELSLSSNMLTTLPAEFGNLQSLWSLHLYYNSLSRLPPQIGQLCSLLYLFLEHNSLTSIPPELGNLSALTHLNLSANYLTAVPAELGGLKSLTQLQLGNNSLSSVPGELGNLSSLQNLYLNDNSLTSLPDELGNLGSLSNLFVQGNKIKMAIPSSFLSITVEFTLDLGYNALYAADSLTESWADKYDSDWAWRQTIAPTNPSATKVSSSAATISWTAANYGDGYEIEASNSGLEGTWATVTTVNGVSSISATVSGLSAGTWYFRIRTFKNPHLSNENRVESAYTEAFVVTLGNSDPVLEPIGNRAVAEGATLLFSVSASDPDGQELTYTVNNEPAGSVFDTMSGAFYWSPGFDQAGTYDNIIFAATDSEGGSDSESITITVTNTNRDPVLDSIGNHAVTEGSALSFTLSATDADGEVVTYSASGLPTEASLDSSTGAFSWTPDPSQVGDHSVTFTASDGNGGSDSETITITVVSNSCSGSPVVTGIDFTGATSGCSSHSSTGCLRGEVISFKPETWQYSWQECDQFLWEFGDGQTSTQREPGHSYSSDGEFTIKLTVSNDNGAATVEVTIAIGAPSTPPTTVDFSHIPDSPRPGEVVSFSGSATGGDPATSWDWNFGDGSTGAGQNVSHMFAAEGNFTVTLTAANSGGSASVQKVVTVATPAAVSPDLITSRSFLSTSESGGSESFTLALATAPADSVLVSVRSGDPTEGLLSDSDESEQETVTLSFTAQNWDVPQTVVVHGIDDDVDDGNQTYSITLTASSGDTNYNGLSATVTVTNIDDDTNGVFVHPTAGLVTSETGGIDEFTLVLTAMPLADVMIGLSVDDPTEGMVDPTEVRFSSIDWSQPQAVTVIGIDDDDADGDVSYSVVTSTTSSDDAGYRNLNVQNVMVTNLDDETSSTDQEGDGVPNDVEDGGPNGGDGNGDGVPDSSQPKVTTLPAANDIGFITIESTCDLRNVEAVPKKDFENTPLLFRHELVSFELPCSVATLMIYFHADESWNPGTGYWKYGPTTPGDLNTVKWYKLPGVRFDTAVVGGASVARAIFTLIDGQIGDDTAVDDVIVDVGGPAEPSSRRRPIRRR